MHGKAGETIITVRHTRALHGTHFDLVTASLSRERGRVGIRSRYRHTGLHHQRRYRYVLPSSTAMCMQDFSSENELQTIEYSDSLVVRLSKYNQDIAAHC